MRRLITAFLTFAAVPLLAQQHEIGLTLGVIDGTARARDLNLGAGTALQANYAYRVVDGRRVALLVEGHFLANPQRSVESNSGVTTHDVASLFVTPGVRLKFAPHHALSPYVAVGGGYALFEQSVLTRSGQRNSAARELSRAAFDYGGGLDYRVRRWLALRVEARDFYTGAPAFNVASPGGQHNIVAGGGFVLRFGGKE